MTSPTDIPDNIRLVRALCEVWEAPDYTAEALAPFFTGDCAVRLMHTLPFAHGPAAVVEQARTLMPLGSERIKVKHYGVQATGPVVVAHRLDTLIIPGKADSDWEMLGVFLIEDGKIKEWTDYMLTPFTLGADGAVIA